MSRTTCFQADVLFPLRSKVGVTFHTYLKFEVGVDVEVEVEVEAIVNLRLRLMMMLMQRSRLRFQLRVQRGGRC
jgi:hypothetical protein